jgi:hypothetical protein
LKRIRMKFCAQDVLLKRIGMKVMRRKVTMKVSEDDQREGKNEGGQDELVIKGSAGRSERGRSA